VALDQLHRHRFSNPSQDLGRPFGVAVAQVERQILKNCNVPLAVALYVENASGITSSLWIYQLQYLACFSTDIFFTLEVFYFKGLI
jgi:hypothetical protein